MTFYLTPQGRCDLLARLEEYNAQKRELEKERSHDIPRLARSDKDGGQPGDHEEIDRQKMVIMQQIGQIEDIIKNAAMAPEPTSLETLQIGLVGTVQRRDLLTDESIGKPERYHVVGYQEGDQKANPPRISYDAPIIANLIGRTVDPNRDPAVVVLGGKRIGVELLSIEFLPKSSQRHLRVVA